MQGIPTDQSWMPDLNNPDQLHLKGLQCGRAGKYREALEWYKKCLKLIRNHGSAVLINAGTACM
jgi:hypothetical protein